MALSKSDSPAVAGIPLPSDGTYTSTTRLIEKSTVLERTCLAVSTLRLMVIRNEFPAPLRLGERRIAWREADVDEWINSRPAAVFK